MNKNLAKAPSSLRSQRRKRERKGVLTPNKLGVLGVLCVLAR